MISIRKGGEIVDQQTVQTILRNYFRLFPNAESIIIADTERYMYYEPSVGLDLHIRVGDPISPSSTTYDAIHQAKRVKEVIKYEEEDILYRSISEPILSKGKVVGAMTAVYPLRTSYSHLPYLTIRTKDRWVPIHMQDIIYLEAYNRKTHISSATYKGTHRNNLTELETKLPAENFFRCHRSYIINLHQIKEIHPDSHSTFILRMADASRIPVSQSYAKRFRKLLDF